jgi:hypothetical protein
MDEANQRAQSLLRLIKESGRPEDADDYDAEIAKFKEASDKGTRQLQELNERTTREAGERDANVDKLRSLFTPVQVLGSERVKNLSSEMQGQVNELLAAAIDEGSENNVYLVRWKELESAMRDELGVTD